MKIMILCTAVFLTAAACGSQPGPGAEGAVITIGDRSVLASDVSESFERFRGDTLSVNVLRDNIIARELFIAHALELGLDQDRETQRLTHERTREFLQSEFMGHILDQVAVDREEVMEFWLSLGTGVQYRALTLDDGALMDSIAGLVNSGHDLAPLAGQFGMDQMTAASEGLVVAPDRMYAHTRDVPFLAGVLEPGQIIGPFEVPLGSRILQIDSVWTYEPEPFAEDSAGIASILLARAREERKIAVEDSLKAAAGVTVNPEAVSLLISSAADLREYREFTPEEQSIIAVSWDGGERNVYSVSTNIMNLPSYMPVMLEDSQWTADYARRLALFDLEMAEAQRLGLDTLPETADRIRIAGMEVLLDMYYAQVIEPRLIVDSVMLEEVYMEIREDAPVEETRSYNVLFLADPQMSQLAEELMSAGEDLMEHTESFEKFPPVLLEGEDYVTIPMSALMVPEKDRPVLFGIDIGEEAIVTLSDTTAIWFRLLEIVPEHIPSMEEIAGRVRFAAEQKIETQVIETLVDSLEAEYHPYVDEEFFTGFHIPAETDSLQVEEGTEGVTDAL